MTTTAYFTPDEVKAESRLTQALLILSRRIDNNRHVLEGNAPKGVLDSVMDDIISACEKVKEANG